MSQSEYLPSFDLKSEGLRIHVGDLLERGLCANLSRANLLPDYPMSWVKVRYLPKQSQEYCARETIVPLFTSFPAPIDTLIMGAGIQLPSLEMVLTNNFLPYERFRTGRDNPPFLLTPDYSIRCVLKARHQKIEEREPALNRVEAVIRRFYEEVTLPRVAA